MDKEKLKRRQQNILDLVRDFCSKRLDEEYFELSERLVQKLGRKRHPPFATGQPHIWAAAVIHALGTINFLFDKSFEPYISLEDIHEYFGTKRTTTAAKSKQICDLLKLQHWDNEFSTKRMQNNNPFDNLVMVDGLIVPLSTLPEHLQKIVREARANGKDIAFATQ